MMRIQARIGYVTGLHFEDTPWRKMEKSADQHETTMVRTPKSLTVTICGGGNAAHVASGYLGSKEGIKVNVLTRRPEAWEKVMQVNMEGSSWKHLPTLYGKINRVSAEPSEVIPGSDVVIIAAPANVHRSLLERIADYISDGCIVGTLYAQGGFDWAAAAAFSGKAVRHSALFGLLNIPWLCRIVKYGKESKMLGIKQMLCVAVLPPEKATSIAEMIGSLFDIPSKIVPNFLSLTLTPSNQIIHPGRYYGIFGEWDGVTPYKKEEIQWGLYSDMNEVSAEWISRLDGELQSIKAELIKRYPSLDLSSVIPLKERISKQYDRDVSSTASLKDVFSTNQGYAGVHTPVKAVNGGFHPAYESRLFWEDIPYGLCILKDIAEMLGLLVPVIDLMIEWHQSLMQKNYLIKGKLNTELLGEMGCPSSFGVTTIDKLVATAIAAED